MPELLKGLSPLCCPCCRSALKRVSKAVNCTGCGMIFPAPSGIPLLVRDPKVHERVLAEARADNPAWYTEEQLPETVSPWRHHLRKRRMYVEGILQRELAKRGTSRALRLLDLGCGDGNNLKWLSPYTEALYGSDYNLLRLTRAAALVPEATVFLANVLDYPASDGAFDVIFFNHVIEHIKNDSAALSVVYRILAPGGLLILGTPNEGGWWWQWAYDRDPQSRQTTDHVHFYTAQTIRERMGMAGFSVFEIKHLGWGPPDWCWDMKLRSYKFLDDLFEFIGRSLLPEQASSLYLLATKG